MKLIAGLGNFEEKYAGTRHNVGFMVLDSVSGKVGQSEFAKKDKFESLFLKTKSVILIKPTTLMNLSGRAVKKTLDAYKVKPNNLWIVHDDLDIALGDFKIQKSKGPRDHKGVNSIEEKLGTKDFWRVRVGVDNRIKEERIPGEAYVLQKFKEEELVIIEKVVEEIADRLVEVVVAKG